MVHLGATRTACRSSAVRGLRDFVSEHKARLGLVITNDSTTRQYEENLLGLPFNWL